MDKTTQLCIFHDIDIDNGFTFEIDETEVEIFILIALENGYSVKQIKE